MCHTAPADLRPPTVGTKFGAVLFIAIASRVIPLLAGSANLVGDTKVEVSGLYAADDVPQRPAAVWWNLLSLDVMACLETPPMISQLSVRVNHANPNHHLWNNNGTWFIHYVVHPTPITKERIRRSLRTKSLEEARALRDALLATGRAGLN